MCKCLILPSTPEFPSSCSLAQFPQDNREMEHNKWLGRYPKTTLWWMTDGLFQNYIFMIFILSLSWGPLISKVKFAKGFRKAKVRFFLSVFQREVLSGWLVLIIKMSKYTVIQNTPHFPYYLLCHFVSPRQQRDLQSTDKLKQP